MPSYTLSVLGLEVSFTTDADERRVQLAAALLDERFERLSKSGLNLSKEKLLTFLALGLADDYLQTDVELRLYEARIDDLLKRLDGM
jgi:cell division protein ZapA